MQNFMTQLSDQAMNPGVFIDIDGVVLKGGKPFDFSREAIHVFILLYTINFKSFCKKFYLNLYNFKETLGQ